MNDQKIKEFRLYDGVYDDGSPGPKEDDRKPILIALIVFFGVAFYSFLIGAGFIYALVWAGWI